MNKKKREQVEKLALWLSTCPIGNEPICYMIDSYKDIQILYDDFLEVFDPGEFHISPEDPGWDRKLIANLSGIMVYCLVAKDKEHIHLGMEVTG